MKAYCLRDRVRIVEGSSVGQETVIAARAQQKLRMAA